MAEWDALALDARDTAVLGPLPIPRSAIVRAKFVAVALFVVGFDVALMLAPTLLRIASLPVQLPVTLAGGLILTLAHAGCALAAGAFGFVAVLGLREALRALIGLAGFRKISAALQALLVVFLATSLLLLPASYGAVARSWMTDGRVSPFAVPPLWFVGLHETLAGRVIDGLPRGEPAAALRRSGAAGDAAVPEPLAACFTASPWSRFSRFSSPSSWPWPRACGTVGGCRRHRWRAAADPMCVGRAFVWLATHLVARDPATQAGFFFTLQIADAQRVASSDDGDVDGDRPGARPGQSWRDRRASSDRALERTGPPTGGADVGARGGADRIPSRGAFTG